MSRFPTLCAVLLASTLSACSSGSKQPEAAVVRPVLTTTATEISSQTIGPFVGTVQPRRQTVMSFQLSGRLLARNVSTGDLVKPGEVLATLESSVQEFQLQTAKANLSSVASQLSNLQDSEARITQLVATGSAPQSQLDAAVTARQTAQAQLDQAQANVDSAQDQVDHTRIIAEAAGVVVSTAAEVGQVVSAGQTILVVAQPDQREAVFDLPESLATTAHVGDTIMVSAVGNTADQLAGVIREIAPSASATARLREVRVTLPAPDGAYRLGTTVQAFVDQPLAAPRVLLPATAILEAGDTTSVWIADPATNTVSTRKVTVTDLTSATVAVTEGLSGGEIVVTAGVHSLKQGQSVVISQGTSE